jgi:hypothetical protein
LERRIDQSPKLKGVTAELFADFYRFGFIQPDASSHNFRDAPFKLRHVFSVEDPIGGNPMYVLRLGTGPVDHFIQSLYVEEVGKNRICVKCYLPGFLVDWDPKNVVLQLHQKVVTLGSPTYHPSGPPICLRSIHLLLFQNANLFLSTYSLISF